MNFQPTMNSPPDMGMDINNFRDGNVNNYDEVRNHSMTSSKSVSRTVSMSLSKALVKYAIK